jgi:hypothetical protein
VVITNNTDRFRFTTKGQIEVLNSAGSVFLGEGAGANQDNSLIRYNVFIGYQAGNSNTTGYSNTACGVQSLNSNTTGYSNTASGTEALFYNTTGRYNTASGVLSLFYNTTGSYNTASGVQSLYSNTMGNNNTASGWYAIGLNTTGNGNTASGFEALYYNTTGSYNVAVGYYAGYGASGVNFSQCTFVGANSYPTTNRTNVTMLGYGITNAECTGDNQVLLGNTSVSQIRAQVTSITGYSDARMKFNVKEDVKGLEFIKKLRPVTFQKDPRLLHKIWGTPDSLIPKVTEEMLNQRHIGLLAQEVERAAKECGFDFPGLDIPRNEHEVYTLRYGDLIMPVIKAVQELSSENEELKKENAELKSRLEEFSDENEALKSRLERLEKIVLQGGTPGNTNLGSTK